MNLNPLSMQLRCILLGAGVMTVIAVEQDAPISTFKTLVKKAFPDLIACDASKLSLYRAVDGVQWLVAGSADEHAALTEGPIPDAVKARLGNALRATTRMNDVGPWPVQENIIHVLVRLPEPPEPTRFVKFARNNPYGELILNVAALIFTVIVAVVVIKRMVDDYRTGDNKGVVFYAGWTLILMVGCVFAGFLMKLLASIRAITGV